MNKINRFKYLSGAILFLTSFGYLFVAFHIPETQASVYTAQGTFTKCSGYCSSTVNIGFQPKAVFYYWNTATANGFVADASAGYGFAASTTAANPVNRSVAVGSNDADTTSEHSSVISATTSIIMITQGASAGTVDAFASTTAFTADGFTLGWGGDANAYIIHYFALGGDDITNTDVDTFSVTTSGTSQAVSSLSFQPDFLMFIWGATTTAMAINNSSMQIGLGIATSSTGQAAIAMASGDANANNTSKVWQQQSTSTILTIQPSLAPTQDSILSLSTMDPTGFTMNKIDPPAATYPVYFMAIKGGRHRVGGFGQPTSAQDQATTTLGFQPDGLFLMTASSTLDGALFGVTAVTTGAKPGGSISVGTASSTANQSAVWFQDINLDSSDANMHSTTTVLAAKLNRSTVYLSQAKLKSFDTTGWTLTWLQADAYGGQFFYWAVGDNPASNITISGNAYENDSGTAALQACDDATPNIKLIVATSTPGQYSTTCADVTGLYQFSSVFLAPAADTKMFAYIDDSASTYGATLTLYAGSGNLTGLDIRASTTIVRSETATSIGTEDFGYWENAQDSDILWEVTAEGITFEQNTKLWINSGDTFVASSTASTTPGGTFARGGDVQIDGTLNMGTQGLTVGGNLMNFGTLTVSAGQTTTFNGTRAGGNSFAPGNDFTFQGLTVGGSVAITASSSVNVAQTLTVGSGAVLTVPSGKNATTTSTVTLTGTINGTGTTTFGSAAIACTNVPSGGTLSVNVRVEATFGGCTVPSRTYGANLEIHNGGTTVTGVSAETSGTLSVSGSLYLRADGTANTTFSGTGSALSVTGGVLYNGGGSGSEIILTGAGAWTVSGNTDFTGGTFAASSTNVFTMNGTAKTLTSAAQAFAGLTLSGTITVADAASSTASLVLSGSAITLNSTASTTGDATLSGTIYPQSQAVVLNGASKTLTGGGIVGSLRTNGSYTLSGADLTVGTSTIYTNGSLTIGSGRFYTSTSTLTLSGTLASASLGNGTTTIQHSNLSTGGTLNSNLRFDATTASSTMPNRTYGGNIEIYSNSASARGVAMTAGTYTIGSSHLILNAANSGNLTLDGGTNNVTLTAASTTFIGAGAGREIMLAGTNPWTFNQNLTTTAGTFKASSATTSIAGDYDNSSGLFVHSSGVVVLDGLNQQTVSGNATSTSAFYDLTIFNNSGTNGTTSPSVIFTDSASTTNLFTATTTGVKIRLAQGAGKMHTFQNIKWDGLNSVMPLMFRSANSGSQVSIHVPGTQNTVSFTDFMDMNAYVTAITADDGTNVDSGDNTNITFPAAFQAPTAVSAANQVFEVGQAATTNSQITVTGGAAAGAITASGGLRIAIATSSAMTASPVDMRWDKTITTAKFGGTASSTAVTTATVSYEGLDASGDASVLSIAVANNFSTGNTLTIDNLKFKSFGTAAASSSALVLFLNGATDQSSNATNTNQYVAIKGAEVLANQTATQEANKLNITQSSVTDAELFAFKLTPASESVNVTGLVIQIPDVNGFACANITANMGLYADYSDNGDVDGLEATFGGTPVCSISASTHTGTLTFSAAFATSTARGYILRSDIASNDAGDKILFSISPSDITASGVVSLQTITPSGSASQAAQFRESNLIGSGSTGASPVYETPVGGGTPGGGSTPPPYEPPTGGGVDQSGGGGSVQAPDTRFFAGIGFALGDIIGKVIDLFRPLGK